MFLALGIKFTTNKKNQRTTTTECFVQSEVFSAPKSHEPQLANRVENGESEFRYCILKRYYTSE